MICFAECLACVGQCSTIAFKCCASALQVLASKQNNLHFWLLLLNAFATDYELMLSYGGSCSMTHLQSNADAHKI